MYLFAITIVALSPKSYTRDRQAIEKTRELLMKGGLESHRQRRPLSAEFSSIEGYEVQPDNPTHCLHLHTSLACDSVAPLFTEKLLLLMHRLKIRIDISRLAEKDDIERWWLYCDKQMESGIDHEWIYKQFHEDMFQDNESFHEMKNKGGKTEKKCNIPRVRRKEI